MIVEPVYVTAALALPRDTRPGPICVTPPLPLTAPTALGLGELKASRPLLTMLVVPSEPVTPLPTCKVPPLIVVGPV